MNAQPRRRRVALPGLRVRALILVPVFALLWAGAAFGAESAPSERSVFAGDLLAAIVRYVLMLVLFLVSSLAIEFVSSRRTQTGAEEPVGAAVVRAGMLIAAGIMIAAALSGVRLDL